MRNFLLGTGLVCLLGIIGSSCGGNTAQEDAAKTQYQQPTTAEPKDASAARNALMPELAASPEPASQPAPAAAPAPATAPEPAPAPAAEPTAAPQPAAPPAPDSFDSNLCANGGADAKDDSNRPRGWAVNPPNILAKSGEGAIQGLDYLALKGVKERVGVLAVPVTLQPEDVGKPLRVEAWGKTPAANSMTIALYYKDGGKDVLASRKFWEKSPKAWSKMEFVETVPASADLSTVSVQITIPAKAGQEFAIDGVSVTRDLLGPNASLELLDDAGRPRGWSASPDGFVSKDKVKPYEGDKALVLKASGDMRGYIARTLELTPEDMGRKLVVSAWGQAEKAEGLTLAVLAGETQLAMRTWPETGGAWQQRVLEVDLPKDADPKSVQVQISLRQGAEGKYAIDLVQAGVK